MVDVETHTADRVAESAERLNVADRLAAVARQMLDATAIVCPRKWSRGQRSVVRGESGNAYSIATFAELDADASQIARGLAAWGVPAGTRLALLVRPGIEFVALVFGLLRAGMVIVLVDPGLGRRNFLRCLAEAEPEGFVAIGLAQAGRLWLRRKFPRARWNVTVGRRWFWGGVTLEQLRHRGDGTRSVPATLADDPAAIIFTSGSTGAPKGVLYTQRMFDTQVAEIQSTFGIQAGGVDLACFPLFALFNSAMGVTTVFPEMNFARPASADPHKLLSAANDWHVSQAFASPAVWRVLSQHCAKSDARIPSLKQVFSCGAPVPAEVLRATLACVGDGSKMHTPYGATECLPVATIEAGEVLGETAARTDQGAGVCVGRKFDSIEWRVIRITDEPIETMDAAEELPAGEIGELVVCGPQVSPRYVTRAEANATSKIADCGLRIADSEPQSDIGERSVSTQYSVQSTQSGGSAITGSPSPFPPPPSALPVWHRTGDVGYLDARGRFWYCGRKSQRLETLDGPMFTECIEAIFNAQPAVRRSALVGVGPRDRQVPVIVVERRVNTQAANLERELLEVAQAHALTRRIKQVLLHPILPVDIRHNAKINREKLADWASKRLAGSSLTSDL